MALCRWSEHSDVYSYATSNGYTIHDARERSWFNCTPNEAINIMLDIRAQGQKVPDHVFLVLEDKIARDQYGVE